MKFPKPWYRKSRRAWFVTFNGQQIKLATSKREALERYRKLLAEPPELQQESGDVPQEYVVGLIQRFMRSMRVELAPDTVEWYRFRLQRFVDFLAQKRWDSLTVPEFEPYHVQEWVNCYSHLSNGSRRNYIRAIQRCMNWCVEQGYIRLSPIAHMKKPPGGKRETVLSQNEFGTLLGLVPDRSLCDLLITTWEIGCRPQESLRVEARHVDLKNDRWVFATSEEKNRKSPRVVYLTDRALEITRRLMLRYPEGTLFRNSKGEPWKTAAVNCAFVRLQVRMGKHLMEQQGIDVNEDEIQTRMKSLKPEAKIKGGVRRKREAELRHEAKRKLTDKVACSLAPKYSLYLLRHSWATHALERGVDALTVAILMGHQDPSTLAKVYQH
ncbi:MAG: hypothetical protein IH897_12280, partial [Planctomycetes bacterium]|nr:hypothetical protein [Planctomycetota bacterium]